jgi:hypothetical protein
MLKAHDNMRYRSKFSRTLVLVPGICESLDYTNHCGCRTYEYSGDVKKTKQNVSGVPVITIHIQ